MNIYKSYIDGHWLESDEKIDVIKKYDQTVYAKMSLNTEKEVEEAVRSAKISQRKNLLSPTERYNILMKAARLLSERKKEIGEIICAECGKPIGESITEVVRAAGVLELSAEEARRISGRGVPVNAMEGFENRRAFTVKTPVGVVCAITPFNYPINLGCHKVGPAIAAGNAVVLKPATETPGCSVKLVEILLEAGLPVNHIQLVLGQGSKIGSYLTKNRNIDLYSFTGSMKVGEKIKSECGVRYCGLELGGNSGVIINNDAKSLELAAQLCGMKGFLYAGQACNRPQRLFVHRDVYENFKQLLVDYTQKVRMGNPIETTTQLGPMISPREVDRVDRWVKEAVAAGAKVLVGGKKASDTLYQATVVENVTNQMDIYKSEIFGPVLVLIPFDKIDEAIDGVNDSCYGLAAGLFSTNMHTIMEASEKINTGVLNINDASMCRPDSIPYGGFKDSGLGKEGPHYAIEEMMHEKLLMLNI